MDARTALDKLVRALGIVSNAPKDLQVAIHNARNVLSVPVDALKPPTLTSGMEPKAFQQGVCILLKSRADAQHLPAKGVKRERAYIEGLMGAGMALQVLGSDQLNPFLILASLGTIRGAVDAVDAVAQGKDLP